MDHLVSLRKKLSTYQTQSGRLQNVSDELLYEVLTAWEQWTGNGAEFYRSIGFSGKQMAKLIGKAKKLKREGHFGLGAFKEVQIEGLEEVEVSDRSSKAGALIELDEGRGVIIRFPQVSQLLEYLKKAS